MTIVVEGKKIATEIQQTLKEKVAEMSSPLFFHIVYVGSDPVIENYLSYKKKFAEAIGITVRVHRFSQEVTEDELVAEVQELAKLQQPMIIQLPLPAHIDTEVVLNQVPAHLDVDVLSFEARTQYAAGELPLVPPVVGSIAEVFDYYDVELKNKRIVVIGEGMLVGIPMTIWLGIHGYDYQVITQETLPETKRLMLKEADVIISGTGVPGLVTAQQVKEGVVVIDAGTSESGSRIVGDIDSAVQEKSSLFTPVPGGIGPLTIAILYRNVVTSYV